MSINLPMFVRFFILSLEIGPNDRNDSLSGHLNLYVNACNWDRTLVLCVSRQMCFLLGHSGRWDHMIHNSTPTEI